MTTLLLDTHVLHWWAVEPERVAPAAVQALEAADELVVSAISRGRFLVTPRTDSSMRRPSSTAGNS